MMTTNYLIVPAVNPNQGKVPISTISKATRFRANPRRSYSAFERKLLFQLIRQYKSVNAQKDPNNPTAKFLPWHIIAEEFNSHEGTYPASATQLSNLYRNVRKKKRNELQNRIMSSLKTEVQVEPDIIEMSDEEWADDSKKPASGDEEGEVVLGLESDLFSNDSEKSSPNENLPSQSGVPSTSNSNLMKVSSKAAEAFMELLNVAEPVNESNVIVLKQKEEEHQLKMSHLAEEHKLKMMVLQAKLDYYRTLREKVVSFTVSKNET